MNNCPACDKPSISNWRKLNATSVFPRTCPECGIRYYISGWWHFSSLLSFEVILWGGFLLAFVLGSNFVFLLIPVALVLYYLVEVKYSKLREITPSQITKARIRAFIEIGVIVLVIVLVTRLR